MGQSKEIHRYYRGQRAESFYPKDISELLEIRARQRTFDGAYSRGALSSLGYALTILRLFDSRFFRIGIVYTVLAASLFMISFVRQRQSLHDFADCYKGRNYENVIRTVGQTGKRVFGRPFVTAGWIVIALTVVVAVVEIGLLVLIFHV
ncbi:hypothetical protein AcW1_002322 [Taiwanofungus camphoratus]|nr:hypothetical protein AcV5_010322 [Antrodia cinnamomea]KAI0944660.1 hypothetical protein AcW1_002322 [Antrodia cinnamomea]KAI0946310.1 hypothetical protein AcV7_010322 [Antrodia cinnamomea]